MTQKGRVRLDCQANLTKLTSTGLRAEDEGHASVITGEGLTRQLVNDVDWHGSPDARQIAGQESLRYGTKVILPSRSDFAGSMRAALGSPS
jgi:hypothetical protein